MGEILTNGRVAKFSFEFDKAALVSDDDNFSYFVLNPYITAKNYSVLNQKNNNLDNENNLNKAIKKALLKENY